MLSALPRVYEEGHNGQAVPSEPEPTMVGGDVQVERLTSAAQETKKRLDVEVIQPIKQWMVAYRTIAVRARMGSGASGSLHARCPGHAGAGRLAARRGAAGPHLARAHVLTRAVPLRTRRSA